MLVHHRQLYTLVDNSEESWNRCFMYSNRAEQALCKLIGIPEAEITQGYQPGYDAWWNGVKYEMKFQNTTALRVEFMQSATNHPSGLATTTADYWIVVSRGELDTVGKVRQYSTNTLRTHVSEWLQFSSQEQFEFGVAKLAPTNVQHNWLGDISWDTEEQIWDLTKWIRKGRPLITQIPFC